MGLQDGEGHVGIHFPHHTPLLTSALDPNLNTQPKYLYH